MTSVVPSGSPARRRAASVPLKPPTRQPRRAVAARPVAAAARAADTSDEKSLEEGAGLMSIGALAEATGVSSRTIRYYEELGILPAPVRSPGGTRKYPRDYVFYVEGALALKELGFSLDEIKVLGRLALGRPMSALQRRKAGEAVSTRMRALEHKIHVLQHLHDVLAGQEVGADAVTSLGSLARIAAQPDASSKLSR